MKYFFLLVTIALTFISNRIIFDETAGIGELLFAIFGVNTALLAIYLLWLSAYFNKYKAKGFSIIGHALLCFSVGLTFIGFGYHGYTSKSCSFLITAKPDSTYFSKLAYWAQSNGYCSYFSFVLTLFGLIIMKPSLMLFMNLLRTNR